MLNIIILNRITQEVICTKQGRVVKMMSVSAIFGVKLATVSLRQSPTTPTAAVYGNGSSGGLMIECSSRPQKKATAHHRKSRPKKTQPWDKNRGPTVYPPLPELPSEWSFATEEGGPPSPSPSPSESQ
ncbi:putative ribosomal protein L6, chloroplast [Helianthus anomalus]